MSTWPLSIAFPLTLLGSITLMLAFDTIASLFTRDRPALYPRLWPLQFALYVLIGFIAMLAVLDIRLVELIGALTGFTESTVGWAISWRIGPGRRPDMSLSQRAFAVSAVTVFCFGFAIVGAILFNAVAAAMLRAHG
jgi:hypothetical protein